MDVIYRDMPDDATQPHDTWIIAFCPDTDSFFATNQRCFFWDTEDVGIDPFSSEEAAISFFENHLKYFGSIERGIMEEMIMGGWIVDAIYLENTGKKYCL